MLQRWIAALNTISSPILAVLVIAIGCAFAVVCKQFGIDGNLAAGIIGAGIGLLTGQVISSSRTQQGGDKEATMQQNTGTPAGLAATVPQGR
jgi:hypothetical protein